MTRRARAWLTLLLLAAWPVMADETLNLSIAVFDAGVPENRAVHRDLKIFPRIRAVEAMLLPFGLREALAETGEWGAVRVVPTPDHAAELGITGEIRRSDVDTLQVHINVVDASGALWIDADFTAAAGTTGLFDAIAAALGAAREQRTAEDLRRIREVSLVRYGLPLAPSAFAGFIDERADGTVEVLRLPARDDPMVERIRLVRATEYVITDAVDAKFHELHADLTSVHELWREYRQKTREYEAMDAERAAATASATTATYEDLLSQYETYKFHRETQQEQDRLAVAFDNEVSPTIEAMEARVRELNAWISNKHSEWYRLLEELFEVETRAYDRS